jgi:hypothetical protein
LLPAGSAGRAVGPEDRPRAGLNHAKAPLSDR